MIQSEITAYSLIFRIHFDPSTPVAWHEMYIMYKATLALFWLWALYPNKLLENRLATSLNNFLNKTSSGICPTCFSQEISALVWIWIYCWRDIWLLFWHSSVMRRERENLQNKLFYPHSATVVLCVLPHVLLPQVCVIAIGARCAHT